jgi:hypothetical protein
MDFTNAMIIGYLTMIISLSAVFFGIRNFRDKFNSGTITFGKAFMTGLYISLIAAVMYALGWEVYYNMSGADFMEQYTQFSLEQMRVDGVPEAEIAREKVELDEMTISYRNPLVRFGYTILEILPVGILISLISAGILSRKKANADASILTT